MITTDKIKIGGIVYRVELIPDMSMEQEASGRVLFGKAQINLDAGLCDDMKNATLLHEVLEVINTENEYHLPHRTIQGLATQLYQVISDNPEVFLHDNNKQNKKK